MDLQQDRQWGRGLIEHGLLRQARLLVVPLAQVPEKKMHFQIIKYD